ncbi:uncharacterized protein SCO4629-like [Erpetoichthys calabaricus]|uniref:uncharacterized protein SCO4629-like n=1 Tax=Erpetoichthys calabaricus TaxID=27687 RepID=UPI0010A0AF5D|nr:uncharacterized protein SCO4629-like [Erpetoichthys calabaricus]
MDVVQKKWAEVLWNYLRLGHTLVKSDVIIGLGCHDLRVAETSARLFLEGWAPWLLFTGYLGNQTAGIWHQSEAEIFLEVAIKMGVPRDRILLEKEATNTGENVRFSFQVLKGHGIQARRVILVQQPFMERRVYATFLWQWPEDKENTHVVVTSPAIDLYSYPSAAVGSMDHLISCMLGVLERIRDYPKKGFQIEQEITSEVLEAYNWFIKAGYSAV